MTMTTLGIDPGRDQGWALLDENGVLVDCGLGDVPAVAFCTKPKVVIERPQIYKGRMSKADPNDIITLAIRVGKATERCEARGCTVEHILPHTWKGSVDAEILCRRIRESLPQSERHILSGKLSGVAESKHHNVIDAIGLAKWSRKRARAGVF